MSSLIPATQPSVPPVRSGLFGILAAVVAVLFILAFAVGGELNAIMLAGTQSLPFAVLAILAYLGVERVWSRVVTLLWLATLVSVTGLLSFGLTIAVLADIPLDGSAGAPSFAPGTVWSLLVLVLGSIVAVALGGLVFVPAVRRRLARVLPLDPASFVHTIALATVITLALLSFLPLLVLGEPPFLSLIASSQESGLDLTSDDATNLRTTVYGLLWTIPCSILAVGYGVRRDLGAALTRLGFVRPTLRQVLIGVAAAVVLVLVVQLLGRGISWFWALMGWPETDGEAFGELMQFAFSPLGAVVVGITAGLGEELAVRGVLQPRLGILLSNLFFTSLHAFQYGWDALLVVFVVGMALGFVRRRTNTTTSAIAHGLYDFILIMASVYAVPYIGE